VIESAGGGGYGPARERERELVLADVEAGLVSPLAARERYGVDVDGRSRAPAATRGRDG
jgi:N-methylhydantoinase B